MEQVVEQFKKYKIQALLVIGGFEVCCLFIDYKFLCSFIKSELHKKMPFPNHC